MTQQQQILNIASRMGADPSEVAVAVALMKSGRTDLIVEVCAARLTIRAALARAKQTKPAVSLKPASATPDNKCR